MPSRAFLLPFVMAVSWLGALPSAATAADLVDLTTATIVVQPGTRPTGERMAAQVLQEELEARLGTRPADQHLVAREHARGRRDCGGTEGGRAVAVAGRARRARERGRGTRARRGSASR